MKTFHKPLFRSQVFFAMCRRGQMMGIWVEKRARRGGRDIFVDRLIHANVTNHYSSDGSSSICATHETEVVIRKFLKFSTENQYLN
jgi:hypothetical protein